MTGLLQQAFIASGQGIRVGEEMADLSKTLFAVQAKNCMRITQRYLKATDLCLGTCHAEQQRFHTAIKP